MKNKMLLRKTCSIYASDMHFAALIFPYISKEIKQEAIIKTILEKNEKENIEKIINNIGLDLQTKEKIRKIDWENTNINKIKNNFRELETEIKARHKIDIVVLGETVFIQKVNKAIDIWFKNNIYEIEKRDVIINVINCYSLYNENNINKILNTHDYILKTSGIEELIDREAKFLKAN